MNRDIEAPAIPDLVVFAGSFLRGAHTHMRGVCIRERRATVDAEAPCRIRSHCVRSTITQTCPRTNSQKFRSPSPYRRPRFGWASFVAMMSAPAIRT